MIEATTFRFHGHILGDPGEYIPKEELAAAIANDPLPRYRSLLIETGVASAADLDAIDADIAQELTEAAAFAFASPKTDVAELKRDVYAEELA